MVFPKVDTGAVAYFQAKEGLKGRVTLGNKFPWAVTSTTHNYLFCALAYLVGRNARTFNDSFLIVDFFWDRITLFVCTLGTLLMVRLVVFLYLTYKEIDMLCCMVCSHRI